MPDAPANLRVAEHIAAILGESELLRRNPDVDLDAIRETCRKYRLHGFGRVLEDLVD
ncbi:hypothetical protein [Haloferula sp. A504]|uniref:hypothetical protein n=1 Tax=Haloferula sp. A504 TaxID=3373601 RepID=UPI0031C4D58E|nr:hypothetical protein [Verrucomicrobiaceae bacterium E54]